ncbi:YbeD family protein [Nitrosovibrio sp. Nv17]|uniref:YbeD family protein n=1 Tax=Nitrosovibrio sp. Nv17 TaxID=1855339 RepID=UPI000908D8C0|nr:DUF493 domain-containing protein [Nitrosovibrio sp. Nv17]SFW33587.1 hypothetical protein SAMN05216414_11928 [Nitrosovibrio sp. Nv17]
MDDASAPPSLIEYPCDFPVKIMGRVDGLPAGSAVPRNGQGTALSSASRGDGKLDFVREVVEIVKRHAPDFDESGMEVRFSGKNTYLSLTCTIRALSRAQLDALYRELCDHPMVIMAL